MQLTLTTSMVGKGFAAQAGETLEVSEAEGHRLIAAGFAVAPPETETNQGESENAGSAEGDATSGGAGDPDEADQTSEPAGDQADERSGEGDPGEADQNAGSTSKKRTKQSRAAKNKSQ